MSNTGATMTLTFDAGLARVERELLAMASKLGLPEGGLEMAWRAGGPAAPYALYVHEDAQAHHPRGGTSHFVTGPLLGATGHLAEDIAADVRSGKTLPQALRENGEILATAMKDTTPVEFGALRDSIHVVGPAEQL